MGICMVGIHIMKYIIILEINNSNIPLRYLSEGPSPRQIYYRYTVHFSKKEVIWNSYFGWKTGEVESLSSQINLENGLKFLSACLRRLLCCEEFNTVCKVDLFTVDSPWVTYTSGGNLLNFLRKGQYIILSEAAKINFPWKLMSLQ